MIMPHTTHEHAEQDSLYKLLLLLQIVRTDYAALSHTLGQDCVRQHGSSHIR